MILRFILQQVPRHLKFWDNVKNMTNEEFIKQFTDFINKDFKGLKYKYTMVNLGAGTFSGYWDVPKELGVDKNELDTDHEAQAGDVLAGVAIPVADKVKTVENKKIVPKKEFRKYYKVKSGDNLTKIANLHGTTLDKVCQLNGFKASRTIEIGQLIRVR